MKIISQTDNELVLKEGSTSGITVGVAFVLAGIGLAVSRHTSAASAAASSSSSVWIWIALALGVIGVVVILLSSSITVGINKTGGQLSYQKKRLIGGSSATYAIADVFRIETRKQWQMQNNPPNQNQGVRTQQPVLIAQSVIVFRNGQEVPLDHQKTSSTMSAGGAVLMSGQGAESAIANKVATFMGVPFQEIAQPNMGLNINIGGPGGIQIR
jgi:hypothetical protein